MNRCLQIFLSIMDNWRKTNSFNYVARATDSVHGLSIDQLRAHYFAVGIGDSVTEIPLIDMLVIFTMIKHEVASLKSAQGKAKRKSTFNVQTEFSDEEAALLLSGMTIHTPFDRGSTLRIEVTDRGSAE